MPCQDTHKAYKAYISHEAYIRYRGRKYTHYVCVAVCMEASHVSGVAVGCGEFILCVCDSWYGRLWCVGGGVGVGGVSVFVRVLPSVCAKHNSRCCVCGCVGCVWCICVYVWCICVWHCMCVVHMCMAGV